MLKRGIYRIVMVWVVVASLLAGMLPIPEVKAEEKKAIKKR